MQQVLDPPKVMPCAEILAAVGPTRSLGKTHAYPPQIAVIRYYPIPRPDRHRYRAGTGGDHMLGAQGHAIA